LVLQPGEVAFDIVESVQVKHKIKDFIPQGHLLWSGLVLCLHLLVDSIDDDGGLFALVALDQ